MVGRLEKGKQTCEELCVAVELIKAFRVGQRAQHELFNHVPVPLGVVLDAKDLALVEQVAEAGFVHVGSEAHFDGVHRLGRGACGSSTA